MKLKDSAALLTVLLASALVFGQKLQDVTAKDSPVSLSIKLEPHDGQHYVFARNNSRKPVLALVASFDFTDSRGQISHGLSRADYVFKSGVLALNEERPIMPAQVSESEETLEVDPLSNEKHRIVRMKSPESSARTEKVQGAVLFVQFEDGSIWGDAAAAKSLLADRPKKLAFLIHLVEAYYQKGNAGFSAALEEPGATPSPESMVAGCLKADAEHQKISAVELAKKRFAQAEEWRAQGIF